MKFALNLLKVQFYEIERIYFVVIMINNDTTRTDKVVGESSLLN